MKITKCDRCGKEIDCFVHLVKFGTIKVRSMKPGLLVSWGTLDMCVDCVMWACKEIKKKEAKSAKEKVNDSKRISKK